MLILEKNILVETAEVSITDIEENDFNRKKRTIEPQQVTKRPIIIQFVSVCYVRLENIIDMEAIKISLMESIKSLEPSDSSINIVRPKVIEIAPIISGANEQKSTCIFLVNMNGNFVVLKKNFHFRTIGNNFSTTESNRT